MEYTDAELQASIAEGGYGIKAGIHPAQAKELIKVPFEYRRRVIAEAHTLCNVVGGIMSGAIYSARTELQRNIDAGEPERELYGENFARVAREREAELRRISGNPNAIYDPFR